jgi:selenide,water dikinase
VDFFTPIVDDPFLYGQIAATNSLSDVYAMGGRPLTAMNLLGVPTDLVPAKMINAILRGGAAKLEEAKCVMVGGHSIRNPEPIYGLSVTGIVNPNRIMTNANARPGDLLVLTKPLGTGIITTGIKRGIASAAVTRKVVSVMRQLNRVGAILGDKNLVKGATDITGFGLLGHLGSMCRASGVSANIETANLPIIGREVFDLIAQKCVPGGTRDNLETANGFTQWQNVADPFKILAADAQTSGGLLLSVSPRSLYAVLRLLKHYKTACAAIIGKIVRGPAGTITVQ